MPSQGVLVIRATGAQGTAVIRNLIKSGREAHAYVVDPTDTRALALQSLGATIFAGALDDRDALAHAAVGCSGLFLNQMPHLREADPLVAEVREAKGILNIAKAAGIKHVVHSTGLGSKNVGERASNNEIAKQGMLGKVAVENLIRNADFETWTIIRPGYFMTNFLSPLSDFMFPELRTSSTLICSYKPDTLLPLVDPNDIGTFVTAAIQNPTRFGQKIIPIASEKKPINQVVKMLGQAAGREIKTVYRTDEESEDLAKINPLVAVQILTLTLAELVDLKEVQQWGIPLGTWEEFLRREKEQVKKTFDQSGPIKLRIFE